MGVLIKTLVRCLILQAIITTGDSAEKRKEVEFSIMIRNEMYDMPRPTVFYRCRSSEKDYGWHKSVPAAEFSWDFTVPPFGNGVEIHHCEFRSTEGTANVEIQTWSTTAMLCDGHLCSYAVRPDGIYFLGYELYNPSNILGRFFEMLRPVEKIVEPWKPWSPRQLRGMRRSHRRNRDDRDDDQEGMYDERERDEEYA